MVKGKSEKPVILIFCPDVVQDEGLEMRQLPELSVSSDGTVTIKYNWDVLVALANEKGQLIVTLIFDWSSKTIDWLLATVMIKVAATKLVLPWPCST